MISDIGDLKGFGVDLMRAVANALDVNVEFRMIPFYVLQDSLRRGAVDAVIAPFDSNLKENQLNSNFTVPYFKNNLVLLLKIISLLSIKIYLQCQVLSFVSQISLMF